MTWQQKGFLCEVQGHRKSFIKAVSLTFNLHHIFLLTIISNNGESKDDYFHGRFPSQKINIYSCGENAHPTPENGLCVTSTAVAVQWNTYWCRKRKLYSSLALDNCHFRALWRWKSFFESLRTFQLLLSSKNDLIWMIEVYLLCMSRTYNAMPFIALLEKISYNRRKPHSVKSPKADSNEHRMLRNRFSPVCSWKPQLKFVKTIVL